MDKNAILAIVLSLLVLLAWQQLFIAPQQKKLQEEQARQAELAQQEGQTTGESSPSPAQQVQNTPQALPSTERLQKRQLDERAEEIRVITPLIEAAISTQGARISSWKVLAHKDMSGNPVELVSTDAHEWLQYPLEIYTGDAAFDEEVNAGIYQSSADRLQLQPGDAPATVSLTYQTQQGLQFTKELRFSPDSYRVEVTLKFSEPVQNMTAISTVLGPGLGVDLEESRQFEAGIVTKTSAAAKPIRETAKKIDGLVTHQGIEWAALNRKYFTTALFAGDANNTLSIHKIPMQAADAETKIEPIRQIVIGLSQSLVSGETHLAFYAGPKERAQLTQAYDGFQRLIDYGFFGFIAEPLAVFMTFLYARVFSNYGVVIIILTILIKILFYPLTHKSFSSMKQMQDLQPHMKVLQEKYKNDRQKLNQEMMKLYKEKGVSPMGGCLPMLLQIPVFFALYQTLSQSIELRGAAFLWMSDLSAPETISWLQGSFAAPYLRPLVILMGVSMFYQQSMTPTAADNKQAQMFKFMPILFTAMFWNFPSGLVLYWFMNNILTIGQQYLINKSGNKPSKKSDDDKQETLSKSRKRSKKEK